MRVQNLLPIQAAAPVTRAIDAAERTWPHLAHLVEAYPDFRGWFWGKVMPELEAGTRRILVEGPIDAPAGLVIAKRTLVERKLCTIWVAEEARRAGVARRLMRDAMDWLGDNRPLLTVPEERLAEFTGLVSEFGFEPTAAVSGLYRAGRTEFVFNGSLRPALNG